MRQEIARRDHDRLKSFTLRVELTDRHGTNLAVWDSHEVTSGPEGLVTIPLVCLFLRGEAPTDNTGFVRLDYAAARRLRDHIEAFLDEWSA